MTLTPEQRKEYEVLLQHLDMKTGTYICLEAAQAIRELLANLDSASTQGRAAGLEEVADRQLSAAYQTGMEGDDFDMLAAKRDIVKAARAALSPTPSDAGKDDARDAALEEERGSFEKWFGAKYHNRLSRNMPDGSYNDPAAYNFFIGWSARASFKQSAILELVADKWVVVEQAVIELPGRRNQLGHTLFSDSKLFNSSDEASEYIKKNDLPLGWVRAKVSHLFDSAALSSLEVIGKGEKG